jgi:hypothetical protein
MGDAVSFSEINPLSLAVEKTIALPPSAVVDSIFNTTDGSIFFINNEKNSIEKYYSGDIQNVLSLTKQSDVVSSEERIITVQSL